MPNSLPSFLVNPTQDPTTTPVNHPNVPANEQPFTGIQNPFFQPDGQTGTQPPTPQAMPSYQVPTVQNTNAEDTRPPVVPAQQVNSNQTGSNPTSNPVVVPFVSSSTSPSIPNPQIPIEAGSTPIPEASENIQAAPAQPAFVPNPNADLTMNLEKLKIEEERKLAEIERQQVALASKKVVVLADTTKQKEENQPQQPEKKQSPAEMTNTVKDTFKTLREVQATQAALHKDMDGLTMNNQKPTLQDEDETLLKPGEENEFDLENRHAKFEDLYKQLKETDISSLSEFSQDRVNRILDKFREKIDTARKATTEVEAIARIASGVRLILRAQRAVEALDALVNTKDEKNNIDTNTDETKSLDTPGVNPDVSDNVNNEESVASENNAAVSAPDMTHNEETPANDNDQQTDTNAKTENEPLTVEKVAELLSPLNDNTTSEKPAA